MDYKEIANSNLMFALCGIVIIFVVIQSLIFMNMAWKRGQVVGIQKEKMKKAMVNSALVSIVPSLPILIFLIVLMPGLGRYFPWLRLSVIGSGTYESMVADSASKTLGLSGISDPGMTPSIYAVIMLTMTIGIIWGLLVLLFGAKSLDKVLASAQGKNQALFGIIISSIFVAMLSIFTAPYFVDMSKGGIVSIGVIIVSALCSVSLNYFAKKYNKSILKEFSLPVCMVLGMLSALVFNNIL